MFLFNNIIFGPVKSRRLGVSLGVNLLPVDAKICSFDCIYCECGFNTTMKESPLPTREQVYATLEARLQQMVAADDLPDVITFAGNGEPTLHPQFEGIIDDTIVLRDRYCPGAKVSVLSNSTRMHKPTVFRALLKVDNNILKFDSALDKTVQRLDRPVGKQFTVKWQIEQLKKFEGNLIIQTMFLRGKLADGIIDNTTENEIEAWLEALKIIRPKQVMIYSIDRETPTKGLEKVPLETLKQIADKARKAGFEVMVA
ncbi:MAG: radical SAM protein [Paludibacter sp.]|nr:radical SAM protein [Paludibacter sp.]MDD4199725.1 radical SAM protein [Paludibacter sp.]MDD4428572.1 radical SAM protein [Paludibacter sp.]